MNTEIKRDAYLRQLILRQNNSLVKVITRLKMCGKSYLLRTLFKNYLLQEGINEDHIIEMAFDLHENIEYQNSKVFFPWIQSKIKDDGQYFILLDEVQLMDHFVNVLNSLADKKNCDVYVTGSNAKFLSRDISTEFGCQFRLNGA